MENSNRSPVPGLLPMDVPINFSAAKKLLCVLAAALAVLLSSCTEPRYFDPLPAVRFGVNAHMPDDEVLDLLEQYGVKWLRLSMSWNLIQPEPGLYDWEFADNRITEISERGFQIFLTISETPAWANPSGASNMPPEDPDLWEEFMFQTAGCFPARAAPRAFCTGIHRSYFLV